MIRISKSDLRILKALPRALNYSEISREAGFSQPYVSNKIKSMKNRFDFVFKVDFWSMSLLPLVVVTEYEPDLLRKTEKHIPYLRTIRLMYRGLKKRLLIELLPPRDRADEVLDTLGVEPLEVYRLRFEVMWRPDKDGLAESRDNRLVVRLERLSEVYRKCREYREAERRIVRPDDIDMVILWKKMDFPFIPLASIGRVLDISQQLISYHFRHHVLSQWMYNGVRVKSFLEPAPLLFIRIDVSAPRYALKLLELAMKLPYTYSAFVTYDMPKSALALLRIPCNDYPSILSQLSKMEGLEDLEVLGLVELEPAVKSDYPFEPGALLKIFTSRSRREIRVIEV